MPIGTESKARSIGLGWDFKEYWFRWQGILGWVLRVSRGTGLGGKSVKGFLVGWQGCQVCFGVRWQVCQWILGKVARVIWSGDKGVIEY